MGPQCIQWLPKRLADPSNGGADLSFLYDPVFNGTGEFVLWYRAGLQLSGGRLTARMRWFADDGWVLVWNTDQVPVVPSDRKIWQPIRLDPPLLPRDSNRLRFAVLVSDGSTRDSIFHGAVSRRPPSAAVLSSCAGSSAHRRAYYPDLQPGRVTAVVTSCGRQDLLERTLDSFFRFNSFPLAGMVVVEDGPASTNHNLSKKYLDRNVKWLATGKQMGQIVAIDYAYSLVNSEFIFHLEDDWEFCRGGFVERSLSLLQFLPNCLQVYIRATDDINGHPLAPGMHTAGGQFYRRVEFGYINAWHGFSFNPGLRRTADYRRLGRYGKHVRHDPDRPGSAEARLSRIYRELGYYAVILADNAGTGYVRHTGDGRRVE